MAHFWSKMANFGHFLEKMTPFRGHFPYETWALRPGLILSGLRSDRIPPGVKNARGIRRKTLKNLTPDGVRFRTVFRSKQGTRQVPWYETCPPRADFPHKVGNLPLEGRFHKKSDL